MVRFFRLLTPLLLFVAVMMYLADFRPASVVLAIAGCASYFISDELQANG